MRDLRGSTLARSVGKLWSAEGVVLLAGLAQAALAARILGPAEFGVAALVMSYPALVFTVLDPRAAEAVVRYLGEFGSDDRDRARAVPRLAYLADAALAVGGFLVVAASAPWAARTFVGEGDRAGLILLFAAASAVSAPSATSRAVLAAYGGFSALAVVQGAFAIGRLLLVTGLLVADWGPHGLVIGVAVAAVLEAAYLQVLAGRMVRRTTGASWRSARVAALQGRVREMVHFMVFTDLTSLMAVLVKQADLLILGLVGGPRQAGLYRAARSLITPVGALVTPLNDVIYPRLARLHARDPSRLLSAGRRYALRIALPLALGVAALIPVAALALPIVLGRDFRDAVPAAVFLLLGASAGVLFFWVRPVFLAAGLVSQFFAITAITALVSLPAFALAGEAWGAAGVAGVRAGLAGVVGNLLAVSWLATRRGRPDRSAGESAPAVDPLGSLRTDKERSE